MNPADEQTSTHDLRRNIDLLKDVTLRIKVELGRGKMFLKDVLRLTAGSVVELDKMAGDPVEIYANDRLVGRGEVLVLNENFCVRVTQIFSPEECLRIKGA
jgi:flagellar motor switch protein FliN/FliY